ncbi:hypothetical protein [Bremerella cremea]|uniref:hypothetical protein n=1 Tax=Bremerella cremea TaxID=1031537 RepID=UPI0031E531A5
MPIVRTPSVIERVPGLLVFACLSLVSGLFLTTASTIQAEEPEATLVAFNREEKQDALRQIPFPQLRPQDQNRVADVVKDPSIFRRLPVQVINCDPELYSFLVSYPEVVVNIWELMGITTVEVQRLSPTTFHANDGAGTVSKVDIIYADGQTNVFFAQGYYEGPLAPTRIVANCVLILRSGYTKAAEGKSFVSNRLDVFVKFESRGADFLAKTLHPLIGKTADYNFAETSSFIGKISKNAEDNVNGMQHLVGRLEKVDPVVRQQMSDVVTRVYQRRVVAEKTLQEKFSGPVPTEQQPMPVASAPVREPALLPQQSQASPVNPVEPAPVTSPIITADASALGPVPRKRFAELRR